MNLLTLFLSSSMWLGQVGQPAELPTKSNQIQVLIQVAQCKNFWVSVHAIEFLAKLGLKKEAESLALTQLKPFEETPQKRIGYWRAQFLASSESAQRNFWLTKIQKAYLTSSGPDRIHAAESLAKLGFSFKNLNHKVVRQDLNSQGMIYSFTRWGYSLGNHPRELPDYTALLKEISNENPQNRTLAAYALGFLLPKMNTATWKSVANSALKEDPNSEAYAYLIGGAYVHYQQSRHHADDLFQEIRKCLLHFEHSSKKSEKIELCKAIATSTSAEDRMIIERIQLSTGTITLDSTTSQDPVEADNLDIKAASAYAWLQMNAQKIK
jgi:solute:Na+ symporter, SSS family